mgnify:CR=1 FL=1
MKKSVMFLLLSLVCLSVSAQNGKVKSGVIGGVSMDWYKDEAMSKGKVGFNIPDEAFFSCGISVAVRIETPFIGGCSLIIWAEAGRNCLGWQ